MIPGGCPHCGAPFQIRVNRHKHGIYTYTFPKCKQTISLKSEPANYTKNLFFVVTSFYGAFIALWLMTKTTMAFPLVIAMLIYNIWMLITIFAKKSMAGIGTKILAILFFVISEGVMAFVAYSVLYKLLL